MFGTLNNSARWAGFFYFLLIPVGMFGLAYVPSVTIVADNPAATMENIRAFELLFRSGNAATLVMNIIAIALVLSLYELFRGTGRILSGFMVALLLIGTTISLVASVGIGASILFSKMGAQEVLPLAQQILFTKVSLDLWKYTSMVAGIFWGLWLFPLGILTYKSGFFPRILGVLLLVSGLAYVVDAFVFILQLDIHFALVDYLWFGEASFTLWLLIFGVRKGADTSI
ncbi:DUF4386 domain-containing protein [Maritalea porphyrae]|uniref:DUF4386 domain-containing protein n=1 Tax=Maritalea porphyrae TaxID=880732 RepID=UPI0022AF9D76|nr:DUF4386 domain-containing protein [Maritalea porphyrae]MCZ4273427.1 DUF4386 domain-containing protein [Maritalea porphyrae]